MAQRLAVGIRIAGENALHTHADGGLLSASAPQRLVAFAGSRVNRADHLRADPQALADLAAGGVLLRLDGLDPVLGAADEAGLLMLDWGSPAEVAAGTELLFLGLLPDGRGCFAAVPHAGLAGVGPPASRLWTVLGGLSPEQLALYGTARSLAGWHARHRFCARCGEATALARGGWQRNCLSDTCRAEHYPRTDPVVIMTVEHDDCLLLGRQPRFPQGRYSALAGFVEPGEAIEEAVAREVWEEAGVRVGKVCYVASQPWPFPASLMIGCHAMAMGRELTIDTTELDDARWFSRAQVAEAMDAAEQGGEGAAFVAPPRHAVAWHLLRHWLDAG